MGGNRAREWVPTEIYFSSWLKFLDKLSLVNVIPEWSECDQTLLVEDAHGRHHCRPAPARPRFSARPQPSVPAAPAVPAVRNNGHGGPQFRGAPPPHHPERNIFNFQPFPRVFNPWHNFYNFAKRPFQDATERNFQEEGRRWWLNFLQWTRNIFSPQCTNYCYLLRLRLLELTPSTSKSRELSQCLHSHKAHLTVCSVRDH